MQYAPLQRKPSTQTVSTNSENTAKVRRPRRRAGVLSAGKVKPWSHGVSRLPVALRGGLEALSGIDLGEVRVHRGSPSPARVGAAAFTHGTEIHVGPGEERHLAHEGWHAVQQAQGRVVPAMQLGKVAFNQAESFEREADTMGARAQRLDSSRASKSISAQATRAALARPRPSAPVVQRAMKFELQTKNTLHRAHGKTVVPLGRKYGPEDYIVKGNSGVRLESEHAGTGYVEFETRWSRGWPKMQKQLSEAVRMTRAMSKAPTVSQLPGFREFPFDTKGFEASPYDIAHLRKPWKASDEYENIGEKPLRSSERLLVKVSDPTWKAGIQVSESFLLRQYESYLKQHEWAEYRDPVIADASKLLAKVNSNGIPAPALVNLKNFLEIIVNYIIRGQGTTGAPPGRFAKGAYQNVKGMPAKQAFVLMNRTNFASIRNNLLSPQEKALFRTLVMGGGILSELGLSKNAHFFRYGYGTPVHFAGPTVHQWLVGIANGRDLLSGRFQPGKGLSGAMGKELIEKSGKHAGLVRFEARASHSPLGIWRTADKWVEFGRKQFEVAAAERPRDSGKGETGLKLK